MKKTLKYSIITLLSLALILSSTYYSPILNNPNDSTVQAKGFKKPPKKPQKPQKPQKSQKIISPISNGEAIHALKLVKKKGGKKKAEKYLRSKLKNVNTKKYNIKWNVKGGKKGKTKVVKKIVVIIQKDTRTKKQIGRAFALETHDIPLSPNPKKKMDVWHYHSGKNNTHYTLKKYIPKGFKAGKGTKTVQ